MKALPDALAAARQLDLDLVEVAPDANPPVVRIMDYNRFKYETAQKARESRKKATNTSIKEMKYRPKIGTGDFSTKTRQVGKFLEEGHKVKVTVTFRGREVSHPELGMKILDELVGQVSSLAKVEASPKLDGKNMTMVLAPDRRAKQVPQDHSGPASEEITEAALGAPNGPEASHGQQPRRAVPEGHDGAAAGGRPNDVTAPSVPGHPDGAPDGAQSATAGLPAPVGIPTPASS